MRLISEAEIADALRPFGFLPAPQFCSKARTYIELLLRWNRRVPLTRVTSTADILRFHFGESLFGTSVSDIGEGRLADVGSGAGFPGAVLALALPKLEVTLIEANGKKAAFLSELKRQLDLANARVHHGRSADVRDQEKFKFVTGRAIGNYGEFLDWSRVHLDLGGRAILWLGSRGVEEVCGKRDWRWVAPVLIPKTTRRFIVVGSPTQQVQERGSVWQ